MNKAEKDSTGPGNWWPASSSRSPTSTPPMQPTRSKSRATSPPSTWSAGTASLKQARDDLSKTPIYAPMSGTVTDLNKEAGEIAIGSQFQEDVIMVIAELGAMEALVNVDENDISRRQARPDGGDRGGRGARRDADRQCVTRSPAAPTWPSRAGQQREQKTEFEVKIAITSDTEQAAPGHDRQRRHRHRDRTRTRSACRSRASPCARSTSWRGGRGRRGAEEPTRPTRTASSKWYSCVEDGKAVARQVETGIQSNERSRSSRGVDEGETVVSGSYRAISRDLVNGAAVTIANKAKTKPGRQR